MNLSFRTRLFILVSVLMILSMSAISVFLLADTKNIMTMEFRERGTLLAREFSQKAAEGIVIEDNRILDKFIHQLFQSKDIRFVYIYSAEGLRLAQRVLADGMEKGLLPKEKAGNFKTEELVIDRNSGHAILDISTPVRYEDKSVGYIRMGISLERIDEEINRRILNSSILLLLSIFLGLFICFLFSRSFSKPVSQLLKGVKKVGQGDLSHSVEVERMDEIGELALAFNEMSERLKESDDRLKKYAQDLEIKVEERTSELKEKNDQLARDIIARKKAEEERLRLLNQLQRAQKMEVVGTLAGGVAHDLNNILSGLVTYPDLILMDIPEDHHLRRSIMVIQESGRKAAAIVQDLLTLARRGVTVTEILNINDIVSSFMESPEFEKMKQYHPDVHFKICKELSLHNIEGSPVHLLKCVMNLISNAAESMPDGGTVEINTANAYLDKPVNGYSEVKEGEYAVLSISDTGVGISSEDVGKIFEPFYTKKVMGRSGTGLGMTVVWGAVQDHRGYIEIQSDLEIGTKFNLYFPSTEKKPDILKECTSLESMKGDEKIVVVDDVPEQREIISLILEKLGYSVDTFSSGEEVIEYMKNNTADLLILDMIMYPGIDGLETYKRVQELHPNQKAIIASGYSETERVKEAREIGVGSYIKKPYSLEKIGLAVRAELDSKNLNSAFS